METIDDKTVGQCVTENIKAADIFQKEGIDFCCGGDILVKKACEQNELDFDNIKQQLLALSSNKGLENDYQSWELSFLAAYIINSHHEYVRNTSPQIIEFANKVAEVHGHDHPQTIEIRDLFHEMTQELESHMQKEEKVLFPYIKVLSNAEKNNTPLQQPGFGTIKNPISMMEHEHDDASDHIKKLALLTNNFTPPEGACNTFRILYAKLEEFQNNLFLHVHLENNILFPKSAELEGKLFS